MPLDIAILTGEASGDRVGGQLAEEIRRLRPDARIWGCGGRQMQRAGVEILWDSSRLGVIGIVSALKIIPRLLIIRQSLQRELRARKPDLLVTVDAGAFNVPLCAWTRKNLPEIPILYYFPPGSWRRQLKDTSLRGVVDHVVTPFPWSETELQRLGVDARFTGHPLLDLVHPSVPTAEFADRYGLNLERPVVGLLPGSRPQEIASILPVQLAAASIIHRRIPGVQFLLGLAPTVDREQVAAAVAAQRKADEERRGEETDANHDEAQRAALPPLLTNEGAVVPADELTHRQDAWKRRLTRTEEEGAGFSLAIVEDATYDMMTASDALLITSGTATLEAAILGKPMVITYRMSRWNLPEYLIVRRKLPEFIGMPNLMAGRCICPEFLQDDATPENLAREIIGLLLEPERLLNMKKDLKAVVSCLGEPGAAVRAAQVAVDLAEGGAPGGEA